MNPSITNQPNYDPVAVQPLRDELTGIGFEELLTPQDVDNMLESQDDKVALVLLNSVCGCAAGAVRPGAMHSVQTDLIPDKLLTLFAGMEKEAVTHYRNKYLADYEPSSPSLTLFRNGKILSIFHRHDLVDKTPEEISGLLTEIYADNCNRRGPSISAKDYDDIDKSDPMCGSDVPKFEG